MYLCSSIFVAGHEQTSPDRRGIARAGAAVVPFGGARAELSALGAARFRLGSVWARIRPRGWKCKGGNAREGDCMRAVRKQFEQRAAREALMGPVGWFSSSSGLGAGRQLADVVTGLPTRSAQAGSTYPWTHVTHVPIRLSILAQRLPRTSPRF